MKNWRRKRRKRMMRRRRSKIRKILQIHKWQEGSMDMGER